ncbi:isopenicillin N synthase family oxygenase [bacterium]|jgi:isopenicillin N synthase-like dioxygenase|nr:isopenicillin N synthase family oxygenase [Verrucomicrobiota bacterium]MDA7497288.1 isopenicillin N synthase family oxygenase [bacterium]MDA7866704.1 isopenicillin N synthase family oxygenase [Verrucomicrobiota bacterium]
MSERGLGEVPVLDFRDYLSKEDAVRERFIVELLKAYREIGFVGVRGHEVDPVTLEATYAAAWKFTQLTDEQKRRYHRPDLFGQRGYTPKGQEHAKGAKAGDLKEFYHVGQELNSSQLSLLGYPENVWPAEVSELKHGAIRVFRDLESLGHSMLKAIFEGLGIRYDQLASGIQEGNSILRIAHYFPISDPASLLPGAVRAAAHGDINLITLLVGASADGLELQCKNGDWMPVQVEADTIVVNVGDMLERLTNGHLRSTIHRVVNPPPEKLQVARLSMPFFMHPRASMDLSVLKCCVDDSNPKRFSDITAGAFLDERLREIGLK